MASGCPGFAALACRGGRGAHALFCRPTYHNPTGAALVPGRRRDVLGIAAAAGAFVIEDDCARWLSHSGQALPSLLAGDADGRVVYLTSLTKAASPSLRVGALIARGPVASRLGALRAVDDLFVSRALLRLTLSAAADEAELDEGIRRLAAAAPGLARPAP